MRLPKVALLLAVTAISTVSAKILRPSIFNLAEGSSITATATCGVNITTPRERFCRLTGASADERRLISGSSSYSGNSQIIAGQLCDYCVAEEAAGDDDSQVHSAKYAIDGTGRWWQSPPLSRGAQFNDVNLTIDLGQEFHVAFVYIKMGNAPRPGVWTLERSTDNGKTYQPWQHFADSQANCLNYFEKSATKKPTYDDDVICTTQFSKIVPLENGEIVVSLLRDRPGSANFSNSPVLQQFTKATNIRLSLQQTKTLQGHLMLVQRQDPTVTRRYFYSVKDIHVGGRCVCNGHADVCDLNSDFKRQCSCQHNTCGDNCDQCCEPYVQKKWRPATATSENACEMCECYNHSDECEYDEQVDLQGLSIDRQGSYEGGGVCKNCQHNTEGINCDKCVHGYYRPIGKTLSDIDVCQPCNCNLNHTTGDCADETGICECLPQFTGPNCTTCAFGYHDPPECRRCDCYLEGTIGQVCAVPAGGSCPCKDNFGGDNCGRCADGFWRFPECIPCTCNGLGIQDNTCEQDTAQCNCQFSFTGLQCDQCANGYFGYPSCSFCDCDETGTVESVCDKQTGQCFCEENFTGARCDRCADGYYFFPECRPCECDTTGTVGGSGSCDDQGQCQCLVNFSGEKCDSCAPGYHNYPSCKSCDCNLLGSYGHACDQDSAQCSCKPNFRGQKCSSCAVDFYNFPTCEACLCNPAGALPVDGYPLGGCGSFNDGYTLCECKSNVEGHICDQCKAGFYDLTKDNSEGCKPCSCHLPGTLLGDNMCDPVTGQCLCKVNVNSDWCQACIPGTYNLQESSVFGCEDCKCDMGGAVSRICDDKSGKCTCRPRIEGRACNKPAREHYFPTLHQLKYELEDGYNPTDDDGAVRFGFNKQDFPDFSWRGYAVFSRIQPEVRINVDVDKPSLFKLIFRYVNRNMGPVDATVVVTPKDPTDAMQEAAISFPSGSSAPQFLTTDTPLVMGRGEWTIAVKTNSDVNVRSDHVLVDYIVLLPQAYYEGGVLQEELRNPCMVPNGGTECLHYTYIDLSNFNQQDGGDSMRADGEDVAMETNRDILNPLNYPELALLDKDQPELIFNMELKKPGKYVFVVGYMSPLRMRQFITVSMQPAGGNVTEGKAILYECQYSSLCRQVVIDMEGSQQILDTPLTNVTVTIAGDADIVASIGYVAAVPEDQWQDEMVKAEIMCVQVKGRCIEGSYPEVPGSIKADITLNANTSSPPDLDDKQLVKLDGINTLMVKFENLVSQKYAVVVTYYQPNHIGFPVNVTVDVNGVMYMGHFNAPYCPNTAGCNSIVMFDDILIQNRIIDVLSSDAIVKIKPLASKDANLWMDFVQLVPTQDVNSLEPFFKLLDPYDLSIRYLSECVGKDFEVDPERGQISPFCRSSIFSVTTEYNNGALPCDCDSQGSESFQCSEFGGACRCKPNVIGRRCDACAQNHYGFPNCKPCNCPATCNPVTGACECPKRVTGPLCDQCVPRTFGYDITIGCMDCKCEERGVLNANLNCTLDYGECDCKPNVVGRTCDVCKNGHWNYPSCEACNCDPAGTTQTICDRETSRCSCKANTGGDTCGECLPGTYNLEARNELGCTKCFCFGHGSSCKSSNMLKSEINNMGGWVLNTTDNETRVVSSGDRVVATLGKSPEVQNNALYWIAPSDYIGNRLTSYGGQIKYVITNGGIRRGDLPSNTRLEGEDVLMSGKGLTIAYRLLSPILDNEVAIDIIESSWRHAKTREMVSREQLMKVLSSVDELAIKANHFVNLSQVSLASVVLDSAVELDTNSSHSSGVSQSFSSGIALSVEMCSCPPGFAGTSCEVCADGFFRKMNGQGAFTCIPCECNGHSQSCDRETGVCSGCQGHTEGDHCERCNRGYTGDPTVEDCIICACPMAIESNNFAESCLLSPQNKAIVKQCDCLPGFMPPYCSECAPGYYGDPMNTTGGNCVPCECNGNIDVSDPGSCNSFGGDCLKCLNNTQGDSCEECADFYWGDAIVAKDCQECDCDQLGSESCDKQTGQCVCKPNVIGDRCDQCAADTWGFVSGSGCTPCNCGIASNSTQCDQLTGDCPCQPGVKGKFCSSCEFLHWGYTADGCKSCECEGDGAVGCSVITGVCQCLQGVTGEKCDRCDDRWVLIPEQGCQACDNCVHTLLDDTDMLQVGIANASASLRIINIGVQARKRLELLNLTVQAVKMRLENVPKKSLDQSQIDGLINNVTELEKEAQAALKEANLVETLSKSKLQAFSQLDDAMVRANTSKDDAIKQVNDILKYIEKRYNEILAKEELKDVAGLLKKAQQLVDGMLKRQEDLDQLLSDAQSAEKSAHETLKKVEEWNERNMNFVERFRTISDTLSDTVNRLNDLQAKAEDAVAKSETAEENLNKLKDLITSLQESTTLIKAMDQMLKDTIGEADELTQDAQVFINNATGLFQQLEKDVTILESMVENLSELYDSLVEGNIEARPKVDAAIAHANSLRLQATDLSSLQDEATQAAVRAAEAYKMIVTSINEAMNASRSALDMALKAIQQSTDIHNNTEQVREESLKLLKEAELLKNETSQDLRTRLQNSIDALQDLRNGNLKTEQKLSETEFNLGWLKKQIDMGEADAIRKKANESQLEAEQAVESVRPLLSTLGRDEGMVSEIPALQLQMKGELVQANENLDSVKRILPNVTSLTESLTLMMPSLNRSRLRLNTSINALRQRIDNARAVANRIKVAVKSNENTSIQIRPPKGFIDSLGLRSELSLFFQTEEENGLLLYIGPKASESVFRHRRATNSNPEFLAIELVDGYVIWKFNIGTETAMIKSNKKYNDNKWYQVIAKRQGRIGELTVRTHNAKDDDVSGSVGGEFTQLDLFPAATWIFAGGVPPNFTLPADVVNRKFIGGLDDYSYSDNLLRLGLWNFESGIGNNKGTLNRGGELAPEISDTARFIAASESYITISKGTLVASERLIVNLQFKTLNKDGILFFMGQDLSGDIQKPDYFKLFIEGGKIHAAIELGGGEITTFIDKPIADGQFHSVVVYRLKSQMFLKVDQMNNTVNGSSRSVQLNQGSNPVLHIGGIPKDSVYYMKSMARHPYFDGCISELKLNTIKKNIMSNYQARVGVVSGCKLTKHAVSYKESKDGEKTDGEGYVHIVDDVVVVNDNFTIRMEIKTKAEEGLLFYASSQDDRSAFSVALVDGKITVTNTAGPDGSDVPRRNELVTEDQYNDGRKYAISVKKTGLELQIAVGDAKRISKVATHRGKKTRTDVSFGYYLGGIREETVDDIKFKDNSPTWKRFVGCMSDVYIENVMVDFALSQPQGQYADYSACWVSDPVDPDMPTTPANVFPISGFVLEAPGPNGPERPMPCTLPADPDVDGVEERGNRFGIKPDSRFEFDSVAAFDNDMKSELRLHNNLRLSVKTYATDGMIWMIGEEKDQSADYAVVYLTEGKVAYKCNLGAGSGDAISTKMINDGKWHTVEVKRQRGDDKLPSGYLSVDGTDIVNVTWPGRSTALALDVPLYVGGLDMSNIRYKYISGKIGKASASSLVGCIADIEHHGKKASAQWKKYGEESRAVETQGCFENQEKGFFIPSTGGSLALGENIVIGVDSVVELSVRPRSVSGVLLLVWGGTDYLGIELFDGKVSANVNNGGGDIKASLAVLDICDGQWRKIRVIKQANVLKLMVALESEEFVERLAVEARGSSYSKSANTKSPVYLGGIPDEANGSRYRPSSKGSAYVGCIKDVTVGGNSFTMSQAKKIGDVSKTCPNT